MIPRTLSASSLQVAALCMDRWVAEYVKRTAGFSNVAADTGTAVHGALEKFVKAFFLDKTHDVSMGRVKQKELLITFYQMSYIETFGTADMETPEYEDGFNLCMRWFQRTDLSTKDMIGVVSCEVKKTIEVPFNHPDGATHTCERCLGKTPGQCTVPFNYIMDRVDQLEETVYEVVDYKTVRVPIQPEDLEVKIQARAYALAIQIEHPDATKIKVTFDLVRHEPVSVWFTRDDNIKFWHTLCAETQRIVNTDEADVRPTLNTNCGFCVKKFTCPLMKKNIAGGGIHSLGIDDSVQLVADLKAQASAGKRMIDELEERIYRHAAANDSLQWVTEDGANEVEIAAGRARSFPFDKAAQIMGPELVAQMGSMTLGNLDKIIKDESLPKEMRDELQGLVTWTTGNLRLKIKPKKKL